MPGSKKRAEFKREGRIIIAPLLVEPSTANRLKRAAEQLKASEAHIRRTALTTYLDGLQHHKEAKADPQTEAEAPSSP